MRYRSVALVPIGHQAVHAMPERLGGAVALLLDPTIVAVGVPCFWLLMDLLIRDGFGLGTRDAGAGLAMLAAGGTFALLFEREASRRATRKRFALLALALLQLGTWVFCLWCLSHEGDGWAAASVVMGVLAAGYFARAAVTGDTIRP